MFSLGRPETLALIITVSQHKKPETTSKQGYPQSSTFAVAERRNRPFLALHFASHTGECHPLDMLLWGG